MTESTASSDNPADETEQTEESEVFTNRAARRAKGKSSAKPGIFAKGQPPAGQGSVQSPRQYGNRRSG